MDTIPAARARTYGVKPLILRGHGRDRDEPWGGRCLPASLHRHAERACQGLVDRIGPPGWAQDDLGGVHRHVAGRAHVDLEPVHAAGGGTELVLAGGVVLRAVAGTLEPLRLLAEGDP